MEVSMSMCDIIRETKNAINARLDMLESLIKSVNYKPNNTTEIRQDIQSLNINTLSNRLDRIESMLSYGMVNTRLPKVEVEEPIPEVIILEKQYSYEESAFTPENKTVIVKEEEVAVKEEDYDAEDEEDAKDAKDEVEEEIMEEDAKDEVEEEIMEEEATDEDAKDEDAKE